MEPLGLHPPHVVRMILEGRLERVERLLADFDALDSRRQRAVNVRELVERFRDAIR